MGTPATGRPFVTEIDVNASAGKKAIWPGALAAILIVTALGYLVNVRNRAIPEQPAARASAASGSVLLAGDIRFIAVDADNSVWCRVANPAGGPDQVAVFDIDLRLRNYPSLRSVVEDREDDIRRLGSLADFWAVDSAGRIWVGPAYYRGRAWTEVARDLDFPGGGISYEQRVAVDAADNAWVPYRTKSECPMGGVCSGAGLAGFTADGASIREIAYPELSDFSAQGLPQLRYVSLNNGRLLAVASRTAYALPETQAIVLPGLDVDFNSGRRDPGFASAATSHGDEASVFSWRDPVDPASEPVVEELQGYRAGWQSMGLGTAPLFPPGSDGRFVTAADYGEDDVLWLASSKSELAARRAGRWTEFFTAQNSPLGAPIRALAVDGRQSLWVGTSEGVLLYRDGVWYPDRSQSGQLYFPAAIRTDR